MAPKKTPAGLAFFVITTVILVAGMIGFLVVLSR